MPPAHDRHRPRYHVMAPANWMNDPNGLVHHNGRWHVFYQYNPNGAFWGTMHWGHAVSDDLALWEHLPVALAPEPDGPDADGCYSGVAVAHDGVPTIVYTGVRKPDELACIATSADEDLRSWTKDPGNPVIGHTPEGLSLTMYRDHTLWREDGQWMMGVGAGIAGEGGTVLLYRSPDLRAWEYLHPLLVEPAALNAEGRIVSSGWECPDVSFHDGRPLLIACEWDGEPIRVSYWTGEYAGGRLEATHKGIVDAGTPFYAPQTFADASGRRVMLGWLREMRPAEAQVAAGWSGALTLPRVVRLEADGTAAFCVAPEIEALRGRRQDVTPGDGEIDRGGIPGDSLEIAARFRIGEGPVGIVVRRSPDGAEATVVTYDPGTGLLSLDTRASSLDPAVMTENASVSMPLAAGEALDLRVFVDHSVIEVYANDAVAISGRIYPTREDSLGARIIGAGDLDGAVTVHEMRDAWR